MENVMFVLFRAMKRSMQKHRDLDAPTHLLWTEQRACPGEGSHPPCLVDVNMSGEHFPNLAYQCRENIMSCVCRCIYMSNTQRLVCHGSSLLFYQAWDWSLSPWTREDGVMNGWSSHTSGGLRSSSLFCCCCSFGAKRM